MVFPGAVPSTSMLLPGTLVLLARHARTAERNEWRSSNKTDLTSTPGCNPKTRIIWKERLSSRTICFSVPEATTDARGFCKSCFWLRIHVLGESKRSHRSSGQAKLCCLNCRPKDSSAQAFMCGFSSNDWCCFVFAQQRLCFSLVPVLAACCVGQRPGRSQSGELHPALLAPGGGAANCKAQQRLGSKNPHGEVTCWERQGAFKGAVPSP